MPFNNEEEINAERKKWALSDYEFRTNFNTVFNELILTGGNDLPTCKPKFIMVGGQAGCGKSMLVGKEVQNLKNGAIIIDQDELRTKHPAYKQIHDEYTEREEFLLLKRYLDKLVNTIIDYTKKERFNLILESALRSVSKFIINTQDVKQDGYNTRLSVLAVHPDEANLSMFTRYCLLLTKYGDCRRNTRVDEDSVIRIPENIEKMDRLGIFDDITVSKRGNKSNNFLPVQVYSQRENPNIPPAYAYKTAINQERVCQENFERRYRELRTILERYKQQVQLERLDAFYSQFKLRQGQVRETNGKFPTGH